MDILAAHQNEHKFLTTEVTREDNLRYDLGNLAAFDPKPIDTKALKGQPNEYLREVARDNVQLLFNRIFKLPTQVPKDGTIGVLATLPKGETIIPREKPVPKPKAPTKWEAFAKEKGIKKKKKDRMVWDENTEGYKPRWGYDRANSDATDWVVEAKKNDDPKYSDPFEQRAAEKKEKIARQNKREAKNKQTSEKKGTSNLPSTISITNDFPQVKKQKKDIDTALSIAQRSTVSMGKFDRLLPTEKPIKEKKKFDPLFNDNEKNKSMKVLTKVLSGEEGKVDMTKAVNSTIQEYQKKKGKQNYENAKSKGNKRPAPGNRKGVDPRRKS